MKTLRHGDWEINIFKKGEIDFIKVAEDETLRHFVASYKEGEINSKSGIEFYTSTLGDKKAYYVMTEGRQTVEELVNVKNKEEMLKAILQNDEAVEYFKNKI